MAKHCFAIKGSPMAIAFAAKIKLYDHNTLNKENVLIRKVRMKFSVCSEKGKIIKTARN